MSLLIKRHGLPKRLAEVYVDFYWSQTKLWGLDIEVSEIELERLEWILDFPVWYLDPHPIPSTVLASPDTDVSHWQRVMDADLRYPLHVLKWKKRLLVLDGIHRLLRAKIEGKTVLAVKIIEGEDIYKILPEQIDLKKGFLKRAIKKNTINY